MFFADSSVSLLSSGVGMNQREGISIQKYHSVCPFVCIGFSESYPLPTSICMSPPPGSLGGGGRLAYGGGGEPIKTTDQGILALGTLCGMYTFSLLTNYVACKAVPTRCGK